MHKLIISIVIFLLPVASYAGDSSLDDKCKSLSDDLVKYMTDNKVVDYSVITVNSFFSDKLRACIHTEVSDFGEVFKIRDVGKTVIKDGPEYFNTLFYCDRNGASSAKLDILKKLDGKVHGLSYREWQDDGHGGLPASLKTPDKPYTKDMCTKLYNNWIKRIK
jgi:hypothetical protein